ALTVRTVEPVTPLNAALIFEVPCDRPLAMPPAGVMVATEGVAEAHVTWSVRSSVELLEKVPVALNCSVLPLAMLGLAGVTAIETSVTLLTVRLADPCTVPSVAVIADVPGATPVAR